MKQQQRREGEMPMGADMDGRGGKNAAREIYQMALAGREEDEVMARDLLSADWSSCRVFILLCTCFFSLLCIWGWEGACAVKA